nr:expressed protein [Hymenolepis microstoma]
MSGILPWMSRSDHKSANIPSALTKIFQKTQWGSGHLLVSGDFAVEDRHSGGGEKVVEDVAPAADSHLIHIAQWHMAWLTSTSARMEKWKIGSTHGSYGKMNKFVRRGIRLLHERRAKVVANGG